MSVQFGWYSVKGNDDLLIGRTKYALKIIEQFKGKTYIGQIDYKKKTITLALRGGISGKRLTTIEVRQAYYHEIVHAVLHDMKSPLDNDEKFVDAFAKRLRWRDEWQQKKYTRSKNAINLVTQRPERLRKLRKKVPRSAGTKKVQAGKH